MTEPTNQKFDQAGVCQRTKQPQLMVIGTCVLDVVVKTIALDQRLDRQAIHRIESPLEVVGGIVGNVGCCLGKLGANVQVASRIGDDSWGHTVVEQLKLAGVDVSLLELDAEQSTGVAFAMVDQQGQRCFLTAPGPHRDLPLAWYQKRCEHLTAGDWLILGYLSRLPGLEADRKALADWLTNLRKQGVGVVADAAGDGGSLADMQPLLGCLDIYAPSIEEARHQTGESEALDAMKCFRQAGAQGLLVVKQGVKGAMISPPGEAIFHQPCLPAPGQDSQADISTTSQGQQGLIVDTIGAGDAFVSGLVCALSQGIDVKSAARLAAATAAFSVTGAGGWSTVRSFNDVLDYANSQLNH